MSEGTQSVIFNAVPLLVLAAAYLVVSAALLPRLWRVRRRAVLTDLALGSLIPCVGVAAAILGAVVLYDGEPIGGHVWSPFAATLVLLVPALLFLAGWRDRDRVLAGPRLREAEETASARGRELDSIGDAAAAFVRAADDEAVARVLVERAPTLLGVEVAAVVTVDEAAGRAAGLLLSVDGEDADWFRDVTLDLRDEPSGVASAVFDAATVAVYDAASSPDASRRFVDAVGARSAVFVPCVAGGRVLAVLVVACTRERRLFSNDDLRLLRTLADEAAQALERTRASSALEQALARERLLSGIARRVRSVLDVDSVSRVAVEEVGRALGVVRCFIRLGEGDEGPLRLQAEWTVEGVEPLRGDARLPATSLATRERRTIAVADVATAVELDQPEPGGRDAMLALDTRSLLAVPIVVFERVIGALGLHRRDPSEWTPADVSLAEGVAREVGLAIHTARLLDENRMRLEQQTALLEAARVTAGELRPGTVLQRLVAEVTDLVRADASNCYLWDPERRRLRSAAVHGLPDDVVGFEFEPPRELAEALAGTGSLSTLADQAPLLPFGHPSHESFPRVIVAALVFGGETFGLLGAATRDPDRVFTRIDQEVLETYASLAALALRNAQAFEERVRQARIERGFYRIAAVLGETVSLSETLDAVAQAASESLGGSFAAVLMPGEQLVLAGGHALPEAVSRALADGIPESAAVLAGSARDRRVLAAPASSTDERFGAGWRSLAAEAGFEALLAVPVPSPRADAGGLVIVFFEERRAFTDEDLELAQQLARAARGALERGELFEKERASRALSQQLARTGTLLATELEPAAVLDEVVLQALPLLRVEACSARVLEGEELVVQAAVGEGLDAAIGSRVSSTARLAGDVLQTRAPVAVANVGDDKRLLEGEPILAEGFRAYLGVPLYGGEPGPLGVLAVYAREARLWRQEEIEALGALASNASAAVANAELYQRVALEKQQSDAILANIADGIVAVDRDGEVVLWNAAAARITGVPAEEALGRTPAQVLRRDLQSAGNAGSGDRLVSIHRGGEEVWLSLTEAVMRDPTGAVAGRIFAFRDISAERVLEQMKSDFVSTVSAQLRTPLTSIYGFAETLLRQDVMFGEDARRTFLGYIASESERLTEIVDTLLNVARLDTGDLQVQLAPTDLAAVVQEVVAVVAEGVEGNGHHFVVDLPGDRISAEADREKLRQILSILVDNAVKYSPEGGTVTVGARRKGETVEVRVVDEGIGIPETEHEHIFKKFYRGDAGGPGRPLVDAGRGGTGLGLFIAQGLVAAMGGRIGVTSEEGEGAAFMFELPLAGAGAGE